MDLQFGNHCIVLQPQNNKIQVIHEHTVPAPLLRTGACIYQEADCISPIAQPSCLLRGGETFKSQTHNSRRRKWEACKNTMKDDVDLENDQTSGLHTSFHTGISLGLTAWDRSWWEDWWSWALINSNDPFAMCDADGFFSPISFSFSSFTHLNQIIFSLPFLEGPVAVSTCLLLSAHLFASSNFCLFLFPVTSHLPSQLSSLPPKLDTFLTS